jgi:hypothetical protein
VTGLLQSALGIMVLNIRKFSDEGRDRHAGETLG